MGHLPLNQRGGSTVNQHCLPRLAAHALGLGGGLFRRRGATGIGIPGEVPCSGMWHVYYAGFQLLGGCWGACSAPPPSLSCFCRSPRDDPSPNAFWLGGLLPIIGCGLGPACTPSSDLWTYGTLGGSHGCTLESSTPRVGVPHPVSSGGPHWLAGN